VPATLGNIALHGLLIALLLAAVVRHTLSPGAFVAYLYALQEYLDHLSSNANRLEALQRFVADLRWAQTFLEMEGEERQTGRSVPEPAGAIRCDDVSFTYPGAAQPALQGINLTLTPGERLALVGENGAGKTTLVKLLLGLYAPTAGRVLAQGVDLQEIDPQEWRAKLGAVFQDYVRYALTARENVGFGRLESLYDLTAIEKAARSSSAATVVAALPQGYETVLGKEFEDGHDLSGGQWQKLALARAYLRDAPIVVLDEPASALDALAEREIYRQFVDLSQEKTMLLITHRLGSARLADRILFLERGQLVEEGTHEELVAAGGRYARLYALQAQWYREPEEGGTHALEA
jgi:ABC-type multidrug transport system fused ATPase/permease subunit